jgi:hypothetical protein
MVDEAVDAVEVVEVFEEEQPASSRAASIPQIMSFIEVLYPLMCEVLVKLNKKPDFRPFGKILRLRSYQYNTFSNNF